ncbi:hypothetical protein C8245_17990 [Paracidovorax avenae]|uniref:NfrA family protein n=1 Tax=Paracidovorax avenae TaxID=80867 RepID=UPI000D21C3DA|nr:hypothetical protein [Paracidovorax avenae]AVS67322.1 hypothetical protein C8245_17990 [Paracidovorax avenae]
MNRLSHRTILAVSLAALWPVAPAMATAGLQHAAKVDESQDDPPLRLAMSYSLSLPRPSHLPDLPTEPVVHAAHTLLDPRDAMARRMRMELALHGDPGAGRGPADREADAEAPRPGKADIVVDMPPPLPWWPARLYAVSNRPPPVFLPAAPQDSTQQAPGRAERPSSVRAGAGSPAEPRPALRKRKSARGPVLRGRAWRLANEGYRAYARGRYERALQRADAALQLRPDVARLQLLRVYALQKLGRNEDALRAAEQAVARGASSPELEAAVANLRPQPAAQGAATTEAYRRGFPVATQAYEQYNRGDYAQAARTAEAAVRLDPSQGPWVLLWLDALQDGQRYEDAIRAGAEAMALGAPNRGDIEARVRLARQAIANQHAQKAYDAIARNKPLEGVADAREAVRLAPDVPSHQMLLIGILQSTQDIAGAEQAATAALQVDEENTAVQLLRAYLRQQLGRSDAAQEDIQAVLGHDWIDDAQRRDTRLIGADLALAARRPAQALALLDPLPADDAQAAARRARAAEATRWGRSAVPGDVTAYAPLQMCRETPYGTTCELQPWDAPGTDNPAARAYAAYGQKRYADAIVLARKAVAEQPANAANQNLLTIALAAGDRAERQEALQRLDAALQAAPADATLLRQRAYLYLAEDRPQLALQDFVAARSTGEAPATNVLDEAYATAATGNRPAAAAMLRQAIDDADAGKLPLDAQQRFDTRSAVGNFSREWGVNASVGYRGARSASNALVGQPVSVPGDSVFSTTEVYWRPPQFLNSSNTTFDVYGRVSNTLRSGTDVTGAQVVSNPCGGTIDVAETRSRGVSGLPSTTGAIGARLTPSASTNLTFGIERQFLLGRASRSGALNPAADDVRCQLNNQASAVNYESGRGSGGWQAYMLYGFYDGTGLRLDASDWFTMEGYLQAGYTLLDTPVRYAVRNTSGDVLAAGEGRLKRGQGFVAGEVRAGRSFLTPYSDRLVIFPHLSVAADWYSNRNRASGVPVAGFGSFDLAGNGRSWSVSAGPGVNFRYWLAGDRYTAQRSHIDWSLQYRANLGGGDASRARGVFMNLSYSY